MLARLQGTLEAVEDDGRALVALPTEGVAYETLAPSHLVEQLRQRIGQTVTLHTLQYLEAHAQGASFTPRLIAFETRQERAFFERLTRVKGLGPRRALRAMARPAGEIAAAICRRDARFLQTLPEIGKRLAETIVVELHGKVDDFSLDPTSDGAAHVVTLPGAAEQAVAALQRLGQSESEAERLVRRAIDRQPDLDTADAILAAAFSE